MVFIFHFVDMAYHIHRFVDIEESLHPWDKSYFVSGGQLRWPGSVHFFLKERDACRLMHTETASLSLLSGR